jgi:hypothetical protein
MFFFIPYRPEMPDDPPAYLTDDELEAALAAIFLAKGGALTREGECFLAGLCARHVVEQLGLASVAAVRVQDQDARQIGHSVA